MHYCPVSHIIPDTLIDILVYDEYSLTAENRSVSSGSCTQGPLCKLLSCFHSTVNFCCFQNILGARKLVLVTPNLVLRVDWDFFSNDITAIGSNTETYSSYVCIIH